MGTMAIVAGGGIGGLVIAAGLVRTGWDVMVYEKAPQLRALGAGITLAPNAVRALDWLGIGDATWLTLRSRPTLRWAASRLPEKRRRCSGLLLPLDRHKNQAAPAARSDKTPYPTPRNPDNVWLPLPGLDGQRCYACDGRVHLPGHQQPIQGHVDQPGRQAGGRRRPARWWLGGAPRRNSVSNS